MAAKALYEKVAELVKLEITGGKFKQGQKIASEKQIVEQYSVSRITVRKAIDKLCDEGLLEKRQGVGTFVTFSDPVEAIVPAIQGSFSAHCVKLHRKPSTLVISQESKVPPERVTSILNIQPGEPAVYIKRLRLMDETPAILEEDYFHPSFHLLLQAELKDRSLFDVLSKVYSTVPQHFEDEFYIETATPSMAEYLKLEAGSSLLCVDQKVFKNPTTILFFNRQLINTEVYRYRVYSIGNKKPHKK